LDDIGEFELIDEKIDNVTLIICAENHPTLLVVTSEFAKLSLGFLTPNAGLAASL
jgi:hypothetical protein